MVSQTYDAKPRTIVMFPVWGRMLCKKSGHLLDRTSFRMSHIRDTTSLLHGRMRAF